jgi:hypothetical protein
MPYLVDILSLLGRIVRCETDIFLILEHYFYVEMATIAYELRILYFFHVLLRFYNVYVTSAVTKNVADCSCSDKA